MIPLVRHWRIVLPLFWHTTLFFKIKNTLNPIPPELFEGGAAWRGGGGGGQKVPAACNSETINDNEMKFGGVVKDLS